MLDYRGVGLERFHCMIYILLYILTNIQWYLFIKDTLGPGSLSTVESLSTLQMLKMY